MTSMMRLICQDTFAARASSPGAATSAARMAFEATSALERRMEIGRPSPMIRKAASSEQQREFERAGLRRHREQQRCQRQEDTKDAECGDGNEDRGIDQREQSGR